VDPVATPRFEQVDSLFAAVEAAFAGELGLSGEEELGAPAHQQRAQAPPPQERRETHPRPQVEMQTQPQQPLTQTPPPQEQLAKLSTQPESHHRPQERKSLFKRCERKSLFKKMLRGSAKKAAKIGARFAWFIFCFSLL